MRTLKLPGLIIVTSLLHGCSGDTPSDEQATSVSSASALTAATPSPEERVARLAAARPIEEQSAAAKSSYAQARKQHRQRELDVARARLSALRAQQGSAADKTALAGVVKEAEAELSRVQQLEAQQNTGAR